MKLPRLLAAVAAGLLAGCDRSEDGAHFDESPLSPEPELDLSGLQTNSEAEPRPTKDTGSRTEFTNDLRGAPPAPTLTPEEGIRLVTPKQAAELFTESTRVPLDVRSPEEYAEGHLAGAKLIDFYSDDFLDKLSKLKREQPFLLYCRSGGRSNSARKRMEELGFEDVAEISGGILAWEDSGNPVVTEPK